MSLFQDLLGQIDLLQEEIEKLRPLDPEREGRVQQKFRLWWSYHSNAIEGNKLTQGETEMFLMEGLTAKGKPLKDHLDLRGHSNAINYLLGFIRDKEELTEATIRKLHEVLLVEQYQTQAIDPNGLPTLKTIELGRYKTHPNHVRTPTGEIHYYATPEETPAKMGGLMAWYRDETSKAAMHYVEIAARFHHRFTVIHPFDDGNGRMARLLMNLMLMQKGYLPAIIRNSERDQYLAGLRSADGEEYDDILVFVAEHVIASQQLYIRAAKGEDIQEPTDLEKEIELLRMELKPIEEPEPLTSAVQERFFKNCIDPLFLEIGRLISPLVELFNDNSTVVTADGNSYRGPKITDLSQKPITALLPDLLQRNYPIRRFNTKLAFTGFKKARFDTFDLSASFEMSFEPLKYLIPLPSNQGGFDIQHFYQELLSKDEISEIATKIARVFVDGIKAKTNGHS